MKCHTTELEDPTNPDKGFKLEPLPQKEVPWKSGTDIMIIFQYLTTITRTMLGKTFVWMFEDDEMARLEQAALILKGDASRVADVLQPMLLCFNAGTYSRHEEGATPLLHHVTVDGKQTIALVFATFAHGTDVTDFPENTGKGVMILGPYQMSPPYRPRRAAIEI